MMEISEADKIIAGSLAQSISEKFRLEEIYYTQGILAALVVASVGFKASYKPTNAKPMEEAFLEVARSVFELSEPVEIIGGSTNLPS